MNWKKLLSAIGTLGLDVVSIWAAFEHVGWIRCVGAGAALAFTILLILIIRPVLVGCKQVIRATYRQIRDRNSYLSLVIDDIVFYPNQGEVISEWRIISCRFTDVVLDSIKLYLSIVGENNKVVFSLNQPFVIHSLSETPMYRGRANLPQSWHSSLCEWAKTGPTKVYAQLEGYSQGKRVIKTQQTNFLAGRVTETQCR